MATPVVVFDTSVFFSYVFNPRRPYSALEALRAGRPIAITCASTMAELREVSLRHVQAAHVDAFIIELQRLTKSFPEPSPHFVHQTDPKHSVFFNRAIEARADYLVT
jgi:predicted nucleic acid-binding protein